MNSPGRRAVATLLVALCVVALGLGSRAAGAPAVVRANVGDALYAALIWVLLGLFPPLATPGRRAPRALLAYGLCAAIEALQAVEAPEGSLLAALRALPGAAYVLGRGFSAADLVRYAVGVGVAVFLEVTITCRSTRRG